MESVSKRTRGGDSEINEFRAYVLLNGPHPKIVGFIYFNENPLQMMNAPCFILKALFIIGKQLNKKAKVNFDVNL